MPVDVDWEGFLGVVGGLLVLGILISGWFALGRREGDGDED